MAVSVRKRFRVFQRDNFTCRYCNRSGPVDGVVLHVDHVHPKSKLGSDDLDNLVTACRDCNLGKKTDIISIPFRTTEVNCTSEIQRTNPVFRDGKLIYKHTTLQSESTFLKEKVSALEREVNSLKTRNESLESSLSFYKKAFKQTDSFLKEQFSRSNTYVTMFLDMRMKYIEYVEKNK